jgi:hypothetical protein
MEEAHYNTLEQIKFASIKNLKGPLKWLRNGLKVSESQRKNLLAGI